MKREAVMALTDEQLRIKVAELLGYEEIRWMKDSGELVGDLIENDEGCGEGTESIPDWPNDIAAAWELEEMITEESKQIEYAESLGELSGADEYGIPLTEMYVRLCHAHPRERTRAFIIAVTGDNE